METAEAAKNLIGRGDDALFRICRDGLVMERVLPTEGAVLECLHRRQGSCSAMWAIAHEGWTVEDAAGHEIAGWSRVEMLAACR